MAKERLQRPRRNFGDRKETRRTGTPMGTGERPIWEAISYIYIETALPFGIAGN